MSKGKVTFGGRSVALFGILGGVVIAVGVSGIALLSPQDLGSSARLTLAAMALIIGGGVALVAAFFGSVMPKEVEGDEDDEKPKAGAGVQFNFGKDAPKPPESPAPPAGDAATKA